MLKLFVGTLLIVFAAQSVQAQITVDVSKITCEQFNVLEESYPSRNLAQRILSWAEGRPSSQINVFEETVRKYRAACRQPDNFKRRVMELYESSLPK